jgi:selenocysteine lyase/cysteine desulfurase
MVRFLKGQISARTRLVAFSHVTCETGTRLPAHEMCVWASERGILSLLDTAQSLGAIPIDVGAIGCDFLTGNGHKWLHGPKGTGLLYARSGLMDRLIPAHVGAGSLEHADAHTGAAEPWATGARFEFGTRSWALASGWKESLLWLTNLDMSRIGGHISATAGYACERIAALPSATLLTPSGECARAGLVSFRCDGVDAGLLGRRLREEASVVSRHVPRHNAVRISTAHFTSEADVDRFCDGLVRVLREA